MGPWASCLLTVFFVLVGGFLLCARLGCSKEEDFVALRLRLRGLFLLVLVCGFVGHQVGTCHVHRSGLLNLRCCRVFLVLRVSFVFLIFWGFFLVGLAHVEASFGLFCSWGRRLGRAGAGCLSLVVGFTFGGYFDRARCSVVCFLSCLVQVVCRGRFRRLLRAGRGAPLGASSVARMHSAGRVVHARFSVCLCSNMHGIIQEWVPTSLHTPRQPGILHTSPKVSHKTLADVISIL